MASHHIFEHRGGVTTPTGLLGVAWVAKAIPMAFGNGSATPKGEIKKIKKFDLTLGSGRLWPTLTGLWGWPTPPPRAKPFLFFFFHFLKKRGLALRGGFGHSQLAPLGQIVALRVADPLQRATGGGSATPNRSMGVAVSICHGRPPPVANKGWLANFFFF